MKQTILIGIFVACATWGWSQSPKVGDQTDEAFGVASQLVTALQANSEPEKTAALLETAYEGTTLGAGITVSPVVVTGNEAPISAELDPQNPTPPPTTTPPSPPSTPTSSPPTPKKKGFWAKVRHQMKHKLGGSLLCAAGGATIFATVKDSSGGEKTGGIVLGIGLIGVGVAMIKSK